MKEGEFGNKGVDETDSRAVTEVSPASVSNVCFGH